MKCSVKIVLKLDSKYENEKERKYYYETIFCWLVKVEANVVDVSMLNANRANPNRLLKTKIILASLFLVLSI